ncbi:hypothetical protein ACFYT3_01940 [Nocardia amikacinitolerans]|uniref:hypothetical protein n=1 Tax=Nocardia amikacinitolerans TaxID=756689 RepID=UPI0020A50A07|nr:hypothetical protein [Nocardia amikacinitolerans]MCP2288153.1 hypothetical protein [Nocardia amikacinitolerans]
MSEESPWRRLAQQARSGELYLDDVEAARQVVAACNQRLDDLDQLLIVARRCENVSGFGDFDMSDVLASKFRMQATGSDDSIDTIIRKDMEVVKDMRDIMAISIARLTDQDYTNAASLTAIIDSVGNQP